MLLQSFGEGKILAAGIPWFSTLFGRDSIIAATQMLIFNPKIARDTLLSLAKYQGKNESDWHEESPGKILHEVRKGEMARCGEIPHTPYYGTVDATPVWLMLYADYYQWTADEEILKQLWQNAKDAMAWIDNQCEKTGYLTYSRRSSRGIDNQGWKDSEDCIVNSQGEMVQGSIALCEVQGYTYSAKMRLSKIAHHFHELELAQRWRKEAQQLKERFNHDFWIAEENYCALALDGKGNMVDSITSNPGHCLSLDIFTPEKATSVAKRLLAEDMFSGWGIRTLSSLSPAYNPMGYHIGSVWPHDNSIIAVGLRTVGEVKSAFAVAQAIMEMTLQEQNKRPPELFSGFPRQPHQNPINYPVACSPQAWATGSIFQLLQMIANLIPDAPNNSLTIKNPTLPDFLDHLSLHNLQVGNTLLDLEFERLKTGTTTCQVVKQNGDLKVLIE